MNISNRNITSMLLLLRFIQHVSGFEVKDVVTFTDIASVVSQLVHRLHDPIQKL